MITTFDDGGSGAGCESTFGGLGGFLALFSLSGAATGGGVVGVLMNNGLFWLIGVAIACHHFCCHDEDEPTCLCKCWWPMCAVRHPRSYLSPLPHLGQTVES
jgi:hypothetical protein